MFVPIRRDPVFHQSYSDASSLQKNVKFFERDKSLNCVWKFAVDRTRNSAYAAKSIFVGKNSLSETDGSEVRSI